MLALRAIYQQNFAASHLPRPPRLFIWPTPYIPLLALLRPSAQAEIAQLRECHTEVQEAACLLDFARSQAVLCLEGLLAHSADQLAEQQSALDTLRADNGPVRASYGAQRDTMRGEGEKPEEATGERNWSDEGKVRGKWGKMRKWAAKDQGPVP